MIYTIYDTSTGEILRTVICDLIQEQLAKGEQYLVGSFSDLIYCVKDGELSKKEIVTISDPKAEAFLIRKKRNEWLLRCDWTQLADNGLGFEDKERWSLFRKALRDLPSQPGFPFDITWPSL